MLRRTASHTPKRPKQTIHTTTKPSLRAKCPRKPTSLQISLHANSHLPNIEVLPTARKPRKPNPTYILPEERTKISPRHCGPQNPAFHKQLWAGVVVQAQRQMWWSCMEQHDKTAALYCPVKTPSDALHSKLPLARTFMGPHNPSALHTEKASTCSPQRPRRQYQPKSTGLCHNAYNSAHRQCTAYLHVSEVRTHSLTPRQIWIHGSILRLIWENKKGLILWVKLQKKYNSLSNIRKRVSFFDSFLRSKVQFFESYFFAEKSSILWVIFKKVGSILWEGFNDYESCWREGFNSVCHVEKKGSMLWVMLKRRFNSASRVEKKDSILRVICFEKINSVGHVQKWVQFFGIFERNFNSFESYEKKVQFFESHWIKSSTFESYWKRVQSVESYWKSFIDNDNDNDTFR